MYSHSKFIDSSVCPDKQSLTVTQPSKLVDFFFLSSPEICDKERKYGIFLLHLPSNVGVALQKVS